MRATPTFLTTARLVSGLALTTAWLAGCSPDAHRPARAPSSSDKGSLSCAEDSERYEQWLPEDDAPAAANGVAYVKMSDWTPPPQVQDVEARIPPRGDAPPVYTTYPKLTLDHEIGNARRARRPLLP